MWGKNEQLKRLVEKEAELAVQTFNPQFTPFAPFSSHTAIIFNILKCIFKKLKEN